MSRASALRLPVFFLVIGHCALVISSSAFAAVDRTQKPEAEPAPAVSFPDYQTETLPNGLKIFVIQDDRKPTVTFRLLVRSGNIFDGKKTGTASFVAALLSRGTKDRDAAQFAQQADFLGMKIEAASAPDSISVTATGLTKYTDQILTLFADAIRNPSFADEQFTKLQRKTLSALQAEKQDSAKLAEKLGSKVIYGAFPYGDYLTPESVQAMAREDLAAFHQRHFLPNNATLAIVGDVQAPEAMAQVKQFFGDWEKGEVPTQALTEIPKLEGLSIHLVNRPGSVQSNILVTMPGPARDTPDVPELNVMNATLGGGFSGRLFQNLREKHGYTYGAYSAFDLRKLAGQFQANAETRNEVTAPAIAETLGEIKRLREEVAPDAEIALQREYNVGNYLLSLENSARTAQRVQDIDLFGLPADFYKTYAKRMSEVTGEQVQELARKYFSTDNLAIVVVGEAKEIQPELEKIGKVTVYDQDLNRVP